MATERDDFIVAQALILSIEALSRLPDRDRPVSNIEDMRAILAEIRPSVRDMAGQEVQRWLKIAAWNIRSA